MPPPSSPEDDQERQRWRAFPRRRPAHIETPGPGQESVWDYPRPPRMEQVSRVIRIEFGGVLVAESQRAFRILETSSPPVYYLPPPDVSLQLLEPADGSTLCEWKGRARYWSMRVGERFVEHAAWSYPDPDPDYAAIRDYLAFYPARMDACFVGEDVVRPQSGGFYGGWITPDVVGPFKGEPGTDDW